MKKIFIVWGRETALSKYIAQSLGAGFKQIYVKRVLFFNLPAFFRYIIQGFWTVGVLLKERPKLVIVQNPPIFAPLLVLSYCRIFGAKLMIDSHTAVFLDKKWQYFHRLFKFIAKRADLNTCHNYKNLEILKKWKVEPAMVFQFYNPDYSAIIKEKMTDEKLEEALTKYAFCIIMVNRFEQDDDWRSVVKTAQKMPNFTFFITGDSSKIKKGELSNKPENVFFTGYLEYDEFIKLMSKANAVISLTKRKDTVLWSIREIMALKKPFITSDSEVLRHYFGEVGEFTNHDPDDMKKKLEKVISQEKEVQKKIDKFLEKDKKRWRNELEQIKNILNIKK